MKKSILLTIFDLSVFGGTERAVINLAKMFQTCNVNITILSFYKQNETLSFQIPENTQIKYIGNTPPCENSLFYKNKYLKFFKYACLSLKWSKFINSFDAVISNDYDILIPLLKNKKTKYIKILHGNYTNTYKSCKALNFFDTIVILCSKEIDFYKKYFHKQIEIIPNFLQKTPNISSNLNNKIVLAVGRFSHEKGFLRLIEIWEILQKKESYKEWALHIVGDGYLKKEIQKEINKKNLQKSIILKPFTKEIEKEYLKASIYVMTSYYEGFPMVLLESSSYQIPTIAFDINTGPSDIIDNEKSGFLIKDGDLNEFANKLCLLMDDENLRKEFGKNAKAKVEENFSSQQILKLWKSVLKI
ncbi:glycosyltransferase family 4 protein [Campylobacter taeniopygiae]|uniref:Glycosyltransferase family 4 protein n=1 Tax=Campylobacter taeniopygiae TaxID=2510188 RepID=A0ABY2TMG3_9BACT|nr:glycosyltransferase family 4 protein [Campylobacter taeniopygiae]TKX34238.1 glycosyltransferase family 4 protein [Campylobacter taeniopygiae]